MSFLSLCDIKFTVKWYKDLADLKEPILVNNLFIWQ